MKPLENSPAPEALALATLLHLARRTRMARNKADLTFIVVNETHGLSQYRQAALWLRSKGVLAISGMVSPEANVPYVQWLNRVCKHLKKTQISMEPHILTVEDLPSEEMAEWGEWFPADGLWLPLPAVANCFRGGALLLTRDNAWTTAECVFLAEWAAIWSHAYALRESLSGFGWQRLFVSLPPSLDGGLVANGSLRFGEKFSLPRILLSMALLAALFIPVHLTVLATADLVPLHPIVLRAPMDGVIDHVLVSPNQIVEKDQPLFEFDRVNLQNRLHVAELELSSIRSEYRQKAQQSFIDPINKSQLSVLQGKIAEQETNVTYLQSLYQRGVVVATSAGIVLFDDPTELVGRPVVTGERVMVVADEHAVEIEAWLSPADAISLTPGTKVTLFLNANPLEPIMGSLRYIAHEAILRPDSHYAYRVRAKLTKDDLSPRIGLKGTAKLEGEKVYLGYWIVRRPLAAARIWLGL